VTSKQVAIRNLAASDGEVPSAFHDTIHLQNVSMMIGRMTRAFGADDVAGCRQMFRFLSMNYPRA
jgi:hypothetical protein